MRNLLGQAGSSLKLDEPVTYWRLWATLLRGSPAIIVCAGVVALVVGEHQTVVATAPVPFVFTAATLGFAVRDMDLLGVVVSAGLTVAYAGLLWTTGIGELVLSRPAPLLSVLGVLVFVAAVAGFGSPTLHGRDRSLAEAQRERQQRQER